MSDTLPAHLFPDIIGFRHSDGGRGAAGGRTIDSPVVRAAAHLRYDMGHDGGIPRSVELLAGMDPLGRLYRDTYDDLIEAIKAAGGGRSVKYVPAQVYAPVLARLGIVKTPPLGRPRPTYTEAYREYGPCIVASNGNNISAILDGGGGRGVLWDYEDERTFIWHSNPAPIERRERRASSVYIPEGKSKSRTRLSAVGEGRPRGADLAASGV